MGYYPKIMFKRWKINSNSYAVHILAVVFTLVIVLPLLLYICSWLLGWFGIESAPVLFTIRISLTAGVVLFGLFLFLLAVEFIQDHLLDAYYIKNKSRKLQLADGGYECQFCGSRKIHASDKECPICGKKLL